jgi:hypothetical protein
MHSLLFSEINTSSGIKEIGDFSVQTAQTLENSIGLTLPPKTVPLPI